MVGHRRHGMLVENGADTESKDIQGHTPLMRAASKRNPAIVKLLLDNGADIESKDNKSRTTLL